MSQIETMAEPLIILTRQEITKLMEFEEYVGAVETAFRYHQEGKSLSPGVLDVEGHGGAFHVKAAGLELSRTYIAVKVNGNFSQNRSNFGLPTIQGAIILSDGKTGSPLAFMDSIEITINRTGAATAVAAKYLARSNSKTATICGCGEQGIIQLMALKHVLPLEQIYAFDIDEERAHNFAEQMTSQLKTTITPVKTLKEATQKSDVIVTCTSTREHFLSPDDVSPGTFIAAVGADSHDKQELDPSLMAQSKVVTDITAQCARIGDLHHAVEKGAMTQADVYAELGEIVAGVKSARASDNEITIFDSTGTAIQDVASAAIAYERALDAGVGYQCDIAG